MNTSTANASVRTGHGPRLLREGHGPGAWHGPDLKAALADVSPAAAFWRSAPGRHNIAEVALHHAYCARAVRAQLSGRTAERFVLEGEDWFPLQADSPLSWPAVQEIVESEQRQLAAVVGEIETRSLVSPLAEAERFDLILGITCHAVYHAGQIQLIKRLREE